MKFIKGNARFTLITEGVVRIEYARDGAFEDAPTLFALRNTECEGNVENGDILKIKTEKLTVYYEGGEFSKNTLFADIHTGGTVCRWRFGDKNKENLKGTLHTLDGVSGFREVPDGLLSRDGWQVIDDSGSCVLCDGFAENRSDSHVYDIYLFAYGNDFKGALSDFFAVSGKAVLPRKSFFGSWYSRWWPYTAGEFLKIAEEYEKNGFPLDILVFDMDWHYQDWGRQDGEPEYLYGYGHAGQNLGWTGYTWNKRLIPEPEKLINTLSERGISVVLNDHPCDGVRDADSCFPLFAEKLSAAGYKEAVPDTPNRISEKEKANPEKKEINFRFNAGDPDYMEAFFEATNSEMEHKNIAFRWLDWQQDYLYPNVNGIKNLSHLRWLNYLYFENSKLKNEKGKEQRRGMSFSRWGGFGDHKHPAWFSGDTITSFETLDFQVQMTVSAGNAGCFFWSHDIGGFQDDVPGGQGEVYARWVQFGAMSAALRVHMCGVEGLDRRPWTWAEPFASSMKRSYSLRSKLFPYIYSSAYESCEKGLPLLRPLYIEYPLNDNSYKYPSTYLLGEGLLVSPICAAGDENYVAKKNVWLPEGTWYDAFTVEKYEGNKEYTVSHGIDTFPLFVKAGFPLVTQPYTNRMTNERLTDPTVIIYTGADGRGLLYEDDGISDQGGFRLSEITYNLRGGTHRISMLKSGGGFEGEASSRDVVFEIKNCDPVAEVICDTHKTELLLEKDTARITVKNVSAEENVIFEVR